MSDETHELIADAKARLKFERMAHIVREVDRAFQASPERRLAPHGVNFGFWAYLRVLWGQDGLSQKALSDLVGLTGPTTHSVVKRMEEADLVELRPIVAGKPRRAVYLSERGKALRNVLEPLAVDVNTLALSQLDESESQLLRTLMLKVHDSLHSDDFEK